MRNPPTPHPPLSRQPDPDLARPYVRLAAEPDGDASADWLAHLAAGRIGVAPPPPVEGGDHGMAGLARLLGLPHPRGGRA